jgi:hypothetical protein
MAYLILYVYEQDASKKISYFAKCMDEILETKVHFDTRERNQIQKLIYIYITNMKTNMKEWLVT